MICLTWSIWNKCSVLFLQLIKAAAHRETPLNYPALMRVVLIKHTDCFEVGWGVGDGGGGVYTDFIRHHPPAPPRSLHAPMMTPPTQVPSIVSRQKGVYLKLLQSAEITVLDTLWQPVAALYPTLSSFPLSWWIVAELSAWVWVFKQRWVTRTEGVNRFCACVCEREKERAIVPDAQACSSVEWFLKTRGFLLFLNTAV